MKFKINKHITAFLFFIFLFRSYSQINVSGSLSDKEGNAIPGVIIKVTSSDSIFVTSSSSDIKGNFLIALRTNQKYILKFSYLGYATTFKKIETTDKDIFLDKIILKESAKNLAEIEVKTTQIRGEQKGDTTHFNADSFKTNPDATAEDLIKKMPGVTSDNSGVKVNGENVQKVLVDGKPFFGEDPNAALKNLPADIFDRVEIFDKMSDQSAFTGFNDGNQQKTMNLVTKKGKNIGYFGKIYGGYGDNERYNGGASFNSFKNKQRVSLLLLTNNINQQNFSMADITGALSNTGQNSGRGGGQSGGGGGRQGGNSGESSLLTSPQNGNTTTQSAGINYSDAWGKKIAVSGSYFFNYSNNKNTSEIVRNYFTSNNLIYNQLNQDQTINQNHRANFKFEYTIDSANKLTINPSITFQNSDTKSSLNASNIISDNKFLSKTFTQSSALNKGYDFSNSILFQHKLKKRGRTISLNLNTQLADKKNNGTYNSQYYYNDSLANTLNQTYKTLSNTKKISPTLVYTEPLNNNAQIQISYNPTYTEGLSDKQTNDYDSTSGVFNSFNTALSNQYNNIFNAQKGGLSYRYQKDKLNFSFGADAQDATLKGQQTFPAEFIINKSFKTILPNAQLNYKFSKSKNLRLNYRTSTNIPSVSQLQNVLDISNPLQLKSGDSELKQTFENNFFARFGGFNAQTSRNAMVFINGSYVNNYISNATYILQSDSNIQGYLAKAGSQLTKPINLNGYYSARVFFVYGFPVAAIKSNLNINGGTSLNSYPTLINNVINNSDNYAFNGGIFVGSNVSKELDFSIAYNGSYNQVNNSVQKQSNNKFITQSTTFKFNWLFLNGFVLNTDLVYTVYNGLSQNFNQEYFLWNAYFGYKFLKDKSFETKISVFDLLNQNRSIGRTITGNYTEDFNTTVLRRYFMVTLTYTFKKFKSGMQPKTETEENPMRNMPGMPYRRHDGGGY